jgi:thioredoxin reductase
VDHSASTLAATGVFIFVGLRRTAGSSRNTSARCQRLHHHRRPDDDVDPGPFAAYDLRVQLTRQVTTAVGDATTAAIAVEKYLAERRNAALTGV